MTTRWLVVAAYFIAAWLSFLASRNALSRERSFWLGTVILLMLLGAAKQLQLQDELTGAARDILKAAGWYGQHEEAQWLLALACGIAILGLSALLALWLRDSGRSAKLAAGALTLLLAFVLLRAASFHALDAWVIRETLGLRLGWWVELAALAFIAASAFADFSGRKRSL